MIAQRERDTRLVDDLGEFRARSSGMVATAIPPALITASQAATIIGVFGARSSTRLPGIMPSCRVNTLAMRFTRAARSA